MTALAKLFRATAFKLTLAILGVSAVGAGLVLGIVAWQVVNFVAFRTAPGLPVLAGGALIIAGGCVVTFWER